MQLRAPADEALSSGASGDLFSPKLRAPGFRAHLTTLARPLATSLPLCGS